MRIKIEGKTKPQTPRHAVKYNGGQWSNCSNEFYNQAMVGNEYDVEIEENAQGFKTIMSGGKPNTQVPKPLNGNSEVMTKADWKEKEKFIAKTAIMKSCLESPALAEAIKVEEGSLISHASLFFKEMWKTFNETHE